MRKGPFGILIILLAIQPNAEKLSKVVHVCTAEPEFDFRNVDSDWFS